MSKTQFRHKKDRFLKRVKIRPVNTITVFPSLVTIINGICGFSAIVFAAGDAPIHHQTGHIAIAAYLVFVAMIADMLDGRLARMSQSTSTFGGQLDSLCDVISFGVAPAFIMLQLVTVNLNRAGLSSEDFLIRFVWLCALAYTSCVVIRLARFNVENIESKPNPQAFIGLPSPAAAGVVCSLVLLHQETLSLTVILITLPFVTLGVGLLMISRITYPHIPNHYLGGKKPFSYLIKLLLALYALVVYTQITLVIIFCGFTLSSLVRAAYFKLKQKETHPDVLDNVPSPEELVEQPPL